MQIQSLTLLWRPGWSWRDAAAAACSQPHITAAFYEQENGPLVLPQQAAVICCSLVVVGVGVLIWSYYDEFAFSSHLTELQR